MQRVFDVENEQDMYDLFNILPDGINKIESFGIYNKFYNSCSQEINDFIKINWHDKTKITRPMPEATEYDIGKLCLFWNYENSDKNYGILINIKDNWYESELGVEFKHCRRLTRQEIEELC